MPDLLILGVGPHALEMLDIVERINAAEQTWNVIGFASAHAVRAGEAFAGYPVFGASAALTLYPEACLVPEYEWPDKAALPRHRLASLIDPSVFVASTARIGLGCVIYPSCSIGSRAQIGDFFFCLSGSVVNHNDIIGDYVTVTSGVVIAGDVQVEAHCYLGQSCTIRELLRIGQGSLLGMGCVVLHDVAPNSVMVGNPARRLRAREPKYPGARAVRRAKRAARKGARALHQLVVSVRARKPGAVQRANERLGV